MWNENAPLELLKNMPKVLTSDNLAEIQKVIDDDKYLCSKKYNGDLCGRYAPFCKNCDKTVAKPCAVAYVRMKIADNVDVEMEDIPSVAPVVVEAGEEPLPERKRSADGTKKIRIAVAKKKHI